MIGSYIADNLGRGADSGVLASDLRLGLAALAERMVELRTIYPTWRDVKAWFAGDADGLAAVRRIIDQGVIIRIGADERLAYRHDRVRDHLLARAIAGMIAGMRFPADLWSDSFYAS